MTRPKREPQTFEMELQIVRNKKDNYPKKETQ